MSLPGADVSVFQGPPADWKTVAGRIRWAGVKITELGPGGSRYVNPDAAADWAYLKASGKGRIAYLFAHPAVSAADSVAFFAAELAPLGLDNADAVALDHETTDGMGPAHCSEWAADVLAGLRSVFDRTPLLYTYPNFAETGNCAGLGGHPLWISDPNHPAGHPAVPGPWKGWAIHQYATSGAIDRNIAAYRTLHAMAAALGKTTPKPPPATTLEDPVLILTGANTDTPIALPDDAKKVRLAAVGETTVNVVFHGHPVQEGVKLDWLAGSREFDVPANSRFLRVFRPADGAPDVPVSVAVS